VLEDAERRAAARVAEHGDQERDAEHDADLTRHGDDA
jgi:hypothetical protein